MFRITLLFLILIWSSVEAQQLTIEGRVSDAQTKAGIPFASVIFSKLKKGTSADEDGNFKLIIEKNLIDELVSVSCVGYESRFLSAKDLNTAQIYLTEKTDELATVKLYQMHSQKRKRVNSFKGKSSVGLGNFSGGAYPSALAKYYKHPEGFDEGCFLSSVEIQFYKIEFQPIKASKFRLRILNVREDGKPGTDLLGTDFILENSVSDRKLLLNLEPYKLNVPAEGFFVVVEHIFIESNKFIETLTFKVNDSIGFKNYEVERYAPIFKGIEMANNKEEDRCYYRGIEGWKPINLLDTKNSVLNGKFPAPAFKIEFTD